METLIVNVSTSARATALLKFLKTYAGVKSVLRGKDMPLASTDWVRSGTPASDKELERMLRNCEQDTQEYSSIEVMQSVRKRLGEWKKNKR